MYVKLQQSGSFDHDSTVMAEVPSQLDKRALLVYCGKFDSMDGPVEVKDEHLDRLAAVHNEYIDKQTKLSEGKVSFNAYPPIQLDHSVLAKDTVGRLMGPLEVGSHTLSDGTTVKALYGTPRILGKENVEKVSDGRWTNLSIGADLETGKFSELTITPFPAAPEASMLKRMANKSESYKGKKISMEPGPEGMSWYVLVDDIKRGPFEKEEDAMAAGKQIVESGILKQFSGGNKMFNKLKKFLMRSYRFTEKQADEHMKHMGEEEKKHIEMAEEQHEKLKRFLVDEKKMSEEGAEKHLAGIDVEKKKELAAEVDEHEKKMAAAEPFAGKETPAEEAAEKKMAAAKASLTKLSTDFRSSKTSVELSMKRSKIATRLARLQSSAKITPAEVKKIDVSRLASESDATMEAVLKSYEDREPVIQPGMYGTKKSLNMGEITKRARLSKLEAETRANMPLLAKTNKARLAGMPSDADEKEDTHQDAPHEAVKHLEEIHKEAQEHFKKAHMAMDAGNIGEAKEHMSHLMDHYKAHMAQMGHMAEGGEASHKVETEMSALAESVTSMQNSFNSMMQLASTLVGTDGK